MEITIDNIIMIIIITSNIILIILYFINTKNLKKLRENYIKLMNRLGNGNNLEESLNNYFEKINQMNQVNEEIMKYCQKLDEEIKSNICRVEILRYNAFEDISNNLSFVIALLDYNGNGIILNGIYSRNNFNIYAKPIKEAKSEYRLTNEEEEVLKRAIKK